MNHDTFNKALDACVEYRRLLDEKTNEVARLREELQEYKDTQITFTLALLENKDLQIARLKELVEWYKSGVESCWHAANTYDGNYVKACDNVMHIASELLLVKEELKAEIK